MEVTTLALELAKRLRIFPFIPFFWDRDTVKILIGEQGRSSKNGLFYASSRSIAARPFCTSRVVPEEGSMKTTFAEFLLNRLNVPANCRISAWKEEVMLAENQVAAVGITHAFQRGV